MSVIPTYLIPTNKPTYLYFTFITLLYFTLPYFPSFSHTHLVLGAYSLFHLRDSYLFPCIIVSVLSCLCFPNISL